VRAPPRARCAEGGRATVGNRLSEVGLFTEALAATEEVVETARRLAPGNPAAYELDLATFLHSLGKVLSEVGRLDEALAPAEEAVELCRRNLQANLLNKLGRLREAWEIRGWLAANDPDADSQE
jgi:tetratricopeptide (TPR) repeat protein